MNNFSELSLSARLRTNLAAHGFKQMTPVQAQAIPAALTGRDIVATAQTGAGKTLAFLIPMLEALAAKPAARVDAVILSPTRELAVQIDEAFQKLAAGTGVRAAVIAGGFSERPQLQAIRKGARVLIATPGRLGDFLERKLVSLAGVSILVLDEADRMLDMGFLPSIKRIVREIPSERQTMCFSATIESSVAGLIAAHVRNPVRVAVDSIHRPAENVEMRFREVEHESKPGALQQMLSEEQGSFLVFARTKHGADRLAKRLVNGGVKAARIHGDRTQNQRTQALDGFRSGYYRVLVATDVVARGIHVDGIAHVVNYDLPQSPEDFIHRVGRTGRAGGRGVATTFAARSERREVREIERKLSIRLTAGEPEPEASAARPKPRFVFRSKRRRR